MGAALRRTVVVGCALAAGAYAPTAAAEPATGPHETVDYGFTTAQVNAPTGVFFHGVYHSAEDPSAPPPYMRRIVFYPPSGMRFDTTVPDKCTAPDVVLAVLGPDACPAGSRVGAGTAEGLFQIPLAHRFLLDHFKHTTDILNNVNEQIVLVKSEGYTVVRGRFQPDGSLETQTPTCFPHVEGTDCLDDYLVQLVTSSFLPAYTRTINGETRSYASTPAVCPASGYWSATIRIWWSDGSDDSVVTQQPCVAPAN
jgi:hypothetical protein